LWYSGGEFGETEDERYVHHGDDKRGNEEANCTSNTPSVIPPEVLSRDDESDSKCPEVYRAKSLF